MSQVGKHRTRCFLPGLLLGQYAMHPTGVFCKLQGDPGSIFYINKEGEAVVMQATPQGQKKVNHLFKADFFGERALLSDEPRY